MKFIMILQSTIIQIGETNKYLIMAKLYYKTKKDSDTGNKMQNLLDKGKAIKDDIYNYVDEIGATKKYMMIGGSVFGTGIIGVEFTTTPDDKIWKKFPGYNGYYKPRLSSTVGKQIEAKFYSFGRIDRKDLNEVIGLESFLSHCGYAYNSKDFFGFEVESKWNHKMPEDCKEITFTEYSKLFNNK